MKSHKFMDVESGQKNCSRTSKCSCIILTPIVLFGLFVIGLVIRTAFISESPFVLEKLDEDPTFLNLTDEEKLSAAKRLQGAIRIPTISYTQTEQNFTALSMFQDYLKDTFPEVFEASYIETIEVNKYSLLFRVEGLQSTKNPYLLWYVINHVIDLDKDFSFNWYSNF